MKNFVGRVESNMYCKSYCGYLMHEWSMSRGSKNMKSEQVIRSKLFPDQFSNRSMIFHETNKDDITSIRSKLCLNNSEKLFGIHYAVYTS